MTKAETGLDLGLSSILSEAKESSTNGVKAGEPKLEPSEFEVPKEEAQKITNNEFETLASEGKWQELRNLCEKRISESGEDDIEARFYWVKSERQLKTLPVSMLAAPLESIASAISGASKFENFKGDVSKLLLEVGNELKGKGEVILGETLCKHARELNSRSKSEELIGPAVVISEGKEEKLVPVRESGDRSGLRLLVFLIPLVLIGLAGLAYTFLEGSGTWDQSPQVALISNDEPSPAALPELERIAKVNPLGLIENDIEREKPTRHEEGSTSSKNIEKKVEDASKQTLSETERAVYTIKKERIDTSGPLEPREVRRALREGDRAREEERTARSPFGEDKPKLPPIRDYGSRLDERRDGQDRFERNENQYFDRARIYSLIRNSGVRRKPSRYAPLVDRLDSGDRVIAEGRFGDWIALKSRSGEKGYIPAEDAEYLREMP